MNKLIYALAALLTLTAVNEVKAQKVAYVNSQVLLDTMPAMDSIRIKLMARSQSLEVEMEEMENELARTQSELEKLMNDPNATAARKELKQKTYQNQYIEYQNMQQLAKSELQAEQLKLLTPLVDEAKKAIAEVAKLKGYTMVLDNSGGSLVLYNLNNMDDITAAVIKHVLSKAPAPKPAPAPVPSPTPAPKPAAGGN